MTSKSDIHQAGILLNIHVRRWVYGIHFSIHFFHDSKQAALVKWNMDFTHDTSTSYTTLATLTLGAFSPMFISRKRHFPKTKERPP